MFWEPPLKIFGGMSKFGIYVIMNSSLQFYQCKGPKKATFFQRRSYLHFAKLRHAEGFTNVKCFHLAFPNIDTFLLFNKTAANHIKTCKYIYITIFPMMQDNSKSRLLFHTVSQPFIPGKILAEKRCRS
jgi:hypothetical protein